MVLTENKRPIILGYYLPHILPFFIIHVCIRDKYVKVEVTCLYFTFCSVAKCQVSGKGQYHE